MRILVPSGTSTPERAAIFAALWPTMPAFREPLMMMVLRDGLLGRADHAVVEGLGVDDGVDRQQDVRRVVDDGGDVARADAQRRGAGGVGRVDHARAAGGEDDVGFLHQNPCHLAGRGADPADDVLRRAGLDSGLEHDLCRLDGAAFGAVVGADNNAVAGLEGNQGLENGGGGGVRRGDDGAHEAEGLGDLPHAVGRVFLNDAAGLRIAVGVVDVFGGKVVLDHLVLDDAHAGLGDRGLRQRDAGLVGGRSRREEDLVHLLLGIACIDLLRRFHARDLGFQGFRGINHRVFLTQIVQLLVFLDRQNINTTIRPFQLTL